MAGDAAHPKAPNYWIRLEDFDGNPDPTAMRAYARSLARQAHFIAALDAKGVEGGAWTADGQFKLREVAGPTPARAVAPKAAAKAPSKIAQAAAAAKADGADGVDIDEALGSLPF